MTNIPVPHWQVKAKQSANAVRLLLRHGVLSGHAGNHAEARMWFQAALDADPDNIVALLWLGWLAPTVHESLVLFSRVLELDPGNERARAAIRWAQRHPSAAEDAPNMPSDSDLARANQPAAKVVPPPTPSLESLGRFDFLQHSLHALEAEEGARRGIAAQRARRLIGPLGSLLMVAVCMFATGVVLIARYSPVTVLAWVLPTPTSTAASTRTFTFTPPASATVNATTTPTPSPLPIASVTNTATATLASSPIPTPTLPLLPPTATPNPPVSAPVAGDEKWIDVDLTHQWLTAYEGSTPVFQAVVSTGLPNTPTVVGQFRIYWKLSATDMIGPGYNLPGVPYTMYFYRGYALHGTYWHNNFGQPMSHGCVNLRTEDAQWLFNWADPPLPSGNRFVKSSDANPGTLVVVHY